MRVPTEGAVVVRRSYNCDIFFQVKAVNGDVALLQGIFHRLIADAPLDDLIIVNPDRVRALLEEPVPFKSPR